MRKNEKITALYERLSRDDFGKDDDQQRESNSISNQKAMLEDFAARQGFTNIVHFTDDGISGTCFDRPGFLALMREVEAGNVEYLCLKDMSRLGRDYLKVGQIMEILRQRGVRLIAINDGVDSARGDDDFTPFRNIMNEYYARDTSRKIRSTFQSKGKSGKHLTGTVIYGYLWNEARDQWLVDPEAAEVVKRIFAMTIDGYGPYQIASKLKEEKILIPSAYLAQHGEGVNKNKTFKDVYGWGSSTICNILEKREYLGHTINFKTRKHFKDKKSHYVPEDEWTIFENTHEPIIDQQTFDLVQKIRGNVRRYPDGWGEAAPLTGLLYCADCGGKMYVHRTNNGKRISQYTCSQYTKVPCGTLCKTQHRINEDVVLSLVSEMLKAIAEYAKHDRAEFVRVVQEAQSSQQTAEVRKQRTRLAAAKQRVSELEVLLCKIYEDNILGKLSDSRYATLDAQYEKEQSELTAEISVLEKAIKSYEKHEKDADRFIALIDKYENFDKLTIAMLNEFIEKILVHSPLVMRLGGQVIKISPNSTQYINPMDINDCYSEEDNPVALKSDFILSLCELIVGGKEGLQAIEKTVIDRCVHQIYQHYFEHPIPENMPILEDLYHALLAQEEKEAHHVATALEIYVKGSLNLFNHRTNVDISHSHRDAAKPRYRGGAELRRIHRKPNPALPTAD